jgi:hypothetical protein
MEYSNNAKEMLDLMDAVDKIDMSEEGMLEMVKDPNSSSGPGTKKIKTPNDYTRDELSKMLSHAMKYVKSGKAPKSWKGDYQSYLNMVGKGMEKFKKINLGNPGYKEGTMKGDMMSGSYKPNKHDKGSTGQRPGPIRGNKIKGMNEDKNNGKRIALQSLKDYIENNDIGDMLDIANAPDDIDDEEFYDEVLAAYKKIKAGKKVRLSGPVKTFFSAAIEDASDNLIDSFGSDYSEEDLESAEKVLNDIRRNI